MAILYSASAVIGPPGGRVAPHLFEHSTAYLLGQGRQRAQ